MLLSGWLVCKCLPEAAEEAGGGHCRGGSGPFDNPEALGGEVGPGKALLGSAGGVCPAEGMHLCQPHPHLPLQQILQHNLSVICLSVICLSVCLSSVCLSSGNNIV